MNKNELATITLEEVLEDLKQAVEQQKPVEVEQFVADWYEENKYNLERNLFVLVCNIHKVINMEELDIFEKWVVDIETKPFQTLVNMHQFGYTIKKEKKYSVKLKGMHKYNECLYFGLVSKSWVLASETNVGEFRRFHTKRELQDSGFGEVFNSPLFEVEEVE